MKEMELASKLLNVVKKEYAIFRNNRKADVAPYLFNEEKKFIEHTVTKVMNGFVTTGKLASFKRVDVYSEKGYFVAYLIYDNIYSLKTMWCLHYKDTPEDDYNRAMSIL